MGLWKRLFPHYGDVNQKRLNLSMSEADELLYRLQLQADDDYHNASESDQRRRSPQGLSTLIRILERARSDHDYDAMFVYDEFPIFSNFGMQRAIPTLRKALGVRNLHGLITQRHLDVHAEAMRAYYPRSQEQVNQDSTHEWDALCTLIFRDRLDEAEEILGMMKERNVCSARELAALMDARNELESPLASGAL